MSLLSSLRSVVSALLRRASVEDDTEEELRAHVQNRTDDLERSGLTRTEAERLLVDMGSGVNPVEVKRAAVALFVSSSQRIQDSQSRDSSLKLLVDIVWTWLSRSTALLSFYVLIDPFQDKVRNL